MSTLHELIQRTDRLRHQLDAMRQTLDELRGDLTRHRETLEAHPAAPVHAEILLPPNGSANGGGDPADPEPAEADATDTDADRRALPRRRGNPIPVLIRRSATDPDALSGWVIDRSPEGLCLLADEEVAVGTLVSVRPTHHAAGLQWFAARVRNCRLERTTWVLGCQFVRELSWDELRLFS